MKATIRIAFFVFVIILIFPLTVVGSETDLLIDTETITMREYNGVTITDKYDAEILTDAGFKNTQIIDERQKEEREKLLNTLFSTDDYKEVPAEDIVRVNTEKAGLFKDDYELSEVVITEKNDEHETLWATLIICIAAMAGLIAGIMIKSKTGSDR